MRSWHGDRRAARIAKKRGSHSKVFILNAIDHQPLLCKGRSQHRNAQRPAHTALCAIAGRHIVPVNLNLRAFWSAHPRQHSPLSLLKRFKRMLEPYLDARETLESLQQRCLELGLVKRRDQWIAVSLTRRRNLREEPSRRHIMSVDVQKQVLTHRLPQACRLAHAQPFIVKSNSLGTIAQTGIALKHKRLDASHAEQIAQHQASRPRPHDDDGGVSEIINPSRHCSSCLLVLIRLKLRDSLLLYKTIF